MAKRVIYIGGSPCSGKSTVAEKISRDYNAFYYKVDDFVDEFIVKAAEAGKPACSRIQEMTADGIWMRSPELQCSEEFLIYDEVAEYIFSAIEALDEEFIVTEGAAFTPNVMKNMRDAKYMTIVPTRDFQIARYIEREWISYVLEGCSNKQEAFDNWMQRDVLFAQQVRAECEKAGIPYLVNDGRRTEDETYELVKEILLLEKR